MALDLPLKRKLEWKPKTERFPVPGNGDSNLVDNFGVKNSGEGNSEGVSRTWMDSSKVGEDRKGVTVNCSHEEKERSSAWYQSLSTGEQFVYRMRILWLDSRRVSITWYRVLGIARLTFAKFIGSKPLLTEIPCKSPSRPKARLNVSLTFNLKIMLLNNNEFNWLDIKIQKILNINLNII